MALAIGAVLVGDPVIGTDVLAMVLILIGVGVLQSGRTGSAAARLFRK